MTQFVVQALQSLLVGVTVLLAGITLLLLLESFAALLPFFPSQRSNTSNISDRASGLESACTTEVIPRVAVLVPAHNEAAVISDNLALIREELEQTLYLSQAALWVIADNCTDATAALARKAGARVLEREDDQARGKGYALDYGLQQLASASLEDSQLPDVVVMLDADCQVQPGAIAALVKAAVASNLPIQGNYFMTLPPDAGLKDRVTAFATRVKNGTRLAGLSHLGLPCLLTGTGMAFPWASLQSVSLASGDLVEDMKLGFDLAIAQQPPQFCAEAVVTAPLPQAEAAARSQRTRWEHGRLDLTRRYWPKLVAAGLSQKRFGPIALALDMAILPLSLLVMVWLAAMALDIGVGWWSGQWAPLWLCSFAGASLALAIVLAWLQVGRQVLPLAQLLLVPLFVLWKLPIYLKFLIRPQQGWVRTERDSVGG